MQVMLPAATPAKNVCQNPLENPDENGPEVLKSTKSCAAGLHTHIPNVDGSGMRFCITCIDPLRAVEASTASVIPSGRHAIGMVLRRLIPARPARFDSWCRQR